MSSLFFSLNARQIKVVLALPDQDLHCDVGVQGNAKLADLGLHALGQLPVVVEQCEDEGDLDLVRREEPAWAGVGAVPEAHLFRPVLAWLPRAASNLRIGLLTVVGCRGNQLRGVLLAGLAAAAHIVEAVAVPWIILWLAVEWRMQIWRNHVLGFVAWSSEGCSHSLAFGYKASSLGLCQYPFLVMGNRKW